MIYLIEDELPELKSVIRMRELWPRSGLRVKFEKLAGVSSIMKRITRQEESCFLNSEMPKKFMLALCGKH